MTLEQTIGNESWVRKNEKAIREIFPKTWTHTSNVNFLRVGFKLKLLGVDWRSENELAKVLAFFEKVNIFWREGVTIKANPNTIFKK